jgi:serine/threonine protein phosphatase PrpC
MNEDSFACMASDTYVVADGMGGHAAGEVASHIFVDTVQEVSSSFKNLSLVSFRAFCRRFAALLPSALSSISTTFHLKATILSTNISSRLSKAALSPALKMF